MPDAGRNCTVEGACVPPARHRPFEAAALLRVDVLQHAIEVRGDCAAVEELWQQRDWPFNGVRDGEVAVEIPLEYRGPDSPEDIVDGSFVASGSRHPFRHRLRVEGGVSANLQEGVRPAWKPGRT